VSVLPPIASQPRGQLRGQTNAAKEGVECAQACLGNLMACHMPCVLCNVRRQQGALWYKAGRLGSPLGSCLCQSTSGHKLPAHTRRALFIQPASQFTLYLLVNIVTLQCSTQLHHMPWELSGPHPPSMQHCVNCEWWNASTVKNGKDHLITHPSFAFCPLFPCVSGFR
jgi:hypothetical protein